MSRNRILIVHTDENVRRLLSSMLQSLGHPIEEAASDPVAVRMLEQSTAGLVLAGTDPADADALEFLSCVRRKHPRTAVILLFSNPHPERLREALHWGAASVLRFPLPATSLRAAVSQILGECEPNRANGNGVGHSNPFPRSNGIGSLDTCPSSPSGNGNGNENGYGNGNGRAHALTANPAARFAGDPHAQVSPLSQSACSWNGLIGEDSRLRLAMELADSIAPTCAPVLIVGEPGTGKSLLARGLHHRSSQRGAAFVEVDCLSLTESQLEVELFGRQSATTGANREGKLAQANGGTLLLEEVSAMSPSVQFRLLRAVQDGEFETTGSSHTRRAEVRFVCSTCEDLASLVERGLFRQDLYYRLNAVTLHLPPLRHRGDDLDRLCDHFRLRFTRALGKEVGGFSTEALAHLRRHGWPGNVLELEHAIQRAVVLCRGGMIEPAHLDLHRRESSSRHAALNSNSRTRNPARIQPLKEALEGPERQLILQALETLNWNRQETARVLDINRTTLYKKMKKYGLLFDEPAWVN